MDPAKLELLRMIGMGAPMGQAPPGAPGAPGAQPGAPRVAPGVEAAMSGGEGGGILAQLAGGLSDIAANNKGLLMGLAQAGAQPGATAASTLAGGAAGVGVDDAREKKEELRRRLIAALRGGGAAPAAGLPSQGVAPAATPAPSGGPILPPLPGAGQRYQ